MVGSWRRIESARQSLCIRETKTCSGIVGGRQEGQPQFDKKKDAAECC